MSGIVYFSVDVEASGPVPALYNLVSIGAVPVARSAAGWSPEEACFYAELKPIAPGFDPGAMAVHGITRDHLERDGSEPERAMRRLDLFVRDRVRERGETPVFVGHNAVFDWAYISYYFERFSLPNPFGYKALDIKALAMGRLGIDWLDTSKENLQVLLPSLPDQDRSRAHRADYDALYQALILAALLNLPGGTRAS
jgi:ribonuclease T